MFDAPQWKGGPLQDPAQGFPPLPTEPLVSIVIPAYNYARFLREAIDSVLSQTYRHIELGVIDDGSTDDTRDVLASYGNRLWWETQPNAGQTAALNRGWRRAKGDVVGYLSADDRLEPGAVTAAVETFQRSPGAVMTYCDFALIDNDSRETRRHHLPSDLDLAAILRSGFSPFGPGSFVRRDASGTITAWDETLSRVPDFDHSLRIARLGVLVHIPRVLASFRVHEGSTSFAAPPPEVTEEAIRVVDRFYATHALPPDIVSMKGQARAMANITAAQGHFRARRWARGLRCCARASGLYPRVLTTSFVYRLVLSGVIGQHIHRWRSRRMARRAADGTPAGGAS